MAKKKQLAVVVEEPFMGDLWFEPDQCPTEPPPEPEGLGDFYDAWPNQKGPGILVQPQAYGDYPPEDFYKFLDAEEYYSVDSKGRVSTTKQLIEGLERNAIFLSSNSKTGASFNIRIAAFAGKTHYSKEKDLVIPGTCKPTEWCFDACYAKTSHFETWEEQTWLKLSRQQRRYLQNLIATMHYAEAPQTHVDRVADDIVEAVHKGLGLKFFSGQGIRPNLRWNGGGDFNEGSARIVNTIARRHPDFLVWGFTRKASTADLLDRRENIRILVSTDPSTPPFGARGDSLRDLMYAAERLGMGLSYATAVQGDERLVEIINATREYSSSSHTGPGTGIRVIFGYHCMGKHTLVGATQECTCSNPRVVGGCQICRWCMMTDAEIAAAVDPEYDQPIRTPVQMYFANGGEPEPGRGYEEYFTGEYDEKGKPIKEREYYHEDPMSYEEAFGLEYEDPVTGEMVQTTREYEDQPFTPEMEQRWAEEEEYWEATRTRLSGPLGRGR